MKKSKLTALLLAAVMSVGMRQGRRKRIGRS